jgi:hypothetical protein
MQRKMPRENHGATTRSRIAEPRPEVFDSLYG